MQERYVNVEKILDIKNRNGLFGEFPENKNIKETRYFRIKWEGFPESEATWEPENHLIDCEFKITAYILKSHFKTSKRQTLIKRMEILHNQLLDEAEQLADREKRLLDKLERTKTKMNSAKPMSITDINSCFNRMAQLGKSRISHYSLTRNEPEIIEIFDSSDEQDDVHKCTDGCCELGRILKELKSCRKKSRRKRTRPDISINPVEIIESTVHYQSENRAHPGTECNPITDPINYIVDSVESVPIVHIQPKIVPDEIINENRSTVNSISPSPKINKNKKIKKISKNTIEKSKHLPKSKNITVPRSKYLSTIKSRMKKESKRTLSESICQSQYVIEQKKRIAKKTSVENQFVAMERAFYEDKISVIQNSELIQMLEEF